MNKYGFMYNSLTFFSVSLGCGGSSSDNNTYIVQSSTTSSPSGTSNSCVYTICPCSTDICRIRYDFTTMVLASQQTSTPVAAGVATDSKNLSFHTIFQVSIGHFFQTLLLEIALRISFPSLHQVPLVHLPFVDTIPVNTWSSTLLDLSVKMSMLLLEPVQQPHGNGISTWHKYNNTADNINWLKHNSRTFLSLFSTLADKKMLPDLLVVCNTIRKLPDWSRSKYQIHLWIPMW